MKNKIYYFAQGISVLALLMIACFGIKTVDNAYADTGHEGATRIEIGRSASATVVTGSSITGTAFASASVKRPDGMYFNNTGSTVWIGTVTTTMQTNHTNIVTGFPVLSSTTFKLGGSYTGSLAFTCDATVATCEIRALEGVVP